MKKRNALGLGLVTTVALAALLAACAAPTTGDAPEATLDGVDALDEGTAWNGMTQLTFGTHNGASVQVAQTFTGSTRRGGGVCITVKEGSPCTDDATTCLGAARARYGSAAYGYCYQGQCYDRPGAPPAYCVTGSDRVATTNSPHTVLKAGTIPAAVYDPNGVGYLSGKVYALGCMTKATGPSTDCGGTNSGLYMRTMSLAGAGSDPLCDATYTVTYNGSPGSGSCYLNYARTCSDGSTSSGLAKTAADNSFPFPAWGPYGGGNTGTCGISDYNYTWRRRMYKSTDATDFHNPNQW